MFIPWGGGLAPQGWISAKWEIRKVGLHKSKAHVGRTISPPVNFYQTTLHTSTVQLDIWTEIQFPIFVKTDPRTFPAMMSTTSLACHL